MDESPSPTLTNLKIQRSDAPGGGRSPRARKRWTRYILIGLLVLFVAFVLLSIVTRAPEVRVSTVTTMYPSQAKQVLIASGYVVAQRKAAVASKGTGRLVELNVVEGDKVAANEVLARIEHSDVDAAAAQAKATVEQLRAAVVQAEAEEQDAKLAIDRAKALLATGSVSQSEYDVAEARWKRAVAGVQFAQANVRAGEAAVRSAAVQVENTYIRAPFAGTVLTKNADVGEVVAPFGASANARGAVVTIADMKSLEVETDVSESQIEKVFAGQPCEITLDAYPDRRYRGRVSKVVPTADRAKATVMTKITFLDLDARVLPEMSAKAAFLSEALSAEAVNGKPHTVVNPDAVLARDGASYAFVVTKDGSLSERKLTLGERIGAMIVVRSGLANGEKVVLKPDAGFSDGKMVTVLQE